MSESSVIEINVEKKEGKFFFLNTIDEIIAEFNLSNGNVNLYEYTKSSQEVKIFQRDEEVVIWATFLRYFQYRDIFVKYILGLQS